MGTYSDHDQRLLDQVSGEEMDRLERRREARDTIATAPVPLASNLVPRYSMERAEDGSKHWMEPDPNGGWVPYEEYAALLQAVTDPENQPHQFSPETPSPRLSDLADNLIGELHRQKMSRMQSVFDGAILTIRPEKTSAEGQS